MRVWLVLYGTDWRIRDVLVLAEILDELYPIVIVVCL
jgi:hypothetical protein